MKCRIARYRKNDTLYEYHFFINRQGPQIIEICLNINEKRSMMKTSQNKPRLAPIKDGMQTVTPAEIQAILEQNSGSDLIGCAPPRMKCENPLNRRRQWIFCSSAVLLQSKRTSYFKLVHVSDPPLSPFRCSRLFPFLLSLRLAFMDNPCVGAVCRTIGSDSALAVGCSHSCLAFGSHSWTTLA